MTDPQQENQEARLVLRAQLGDRAALDSLLLRIQHRLIDFLCHRLGSQADAEDCAQQVLIKICRNLGGLREPRALRPWMYRIAAREASRGSRGIQREVALDPLLAEGLLAPEPDEFPFEEWIPTLHKQLGRLPANSREVLFLHYLEGLTLAEVGKVLETPLGTVKSRLGYGLAKLRKQLKEKEV